MKESKTEASLLVTPGAQPTTLVPKMPILSSAEKKQASKTKDKL